MSYLSKEDILKAPAGIIVEHEVPKWGGSVGIKSFNLRERDELGKLITDANDDGDNAKILVSVLALTLVDADGNQLFSVDEAEALLDKDASVIESIALEALRVNGLDPKAAEEVEKN